MPLGPIHLLVVKFPGSQFRGDIVPALAELVDKDYIRVVDIAFAARDTNGVLTITELSQLPDADFELYDLLISDVTGLIAEQDLLSLADSLEPGTSAAMLLYEEPWAKGLRDALRGAHAEVLAHEMIPHEVVELAVAVSESLLSDL